MSSDGGDGDETIYGFLPGSIEPYVSHTQFFFLNYYPFATHRKFAEIDESTATNGHTHIEIHAHT